MRQGLKRLWLADKSSESVMQATESEESCTIHLRGVASHLSGKPDGEAAKDSIGENSKAVAERQRHGETARQKASPGRPNHERRKKRNMYHRLVHGQERGTSFCGKVSKILRKENRFEV